MIMEQQWDLTWREVLIIMIGPLIVLVLDIIVRFYLR